MSALGHQRPLTIVPAQGPLSGTKRPPKTAGSQLYLCLLGQFQRVIHFNTQVSNRAFELGMPKQ